MDISKPGYLLIAEEIAAQIETGILRPGDKLPSGRELQQHYGVSETTTRGAMVDLRARRLVYGRPGVGVFVADRRA